MWTLWTNLATWANSTIDSLFKRATKTSTGSHKTSTRAVKLLELGANSVLSVMDLQTCHAFCILDYLPIRHHRNHGLWYKHLQMQYEQMLRSWILKRGERGIGLIVRAPFQWMGANMSSLWTKRKTKHFSLSTYSKSFSSLPNGSSNSIAINSRPTNLQINRNIGKQCTKWEKTVSI